MKPLVSQRTVLRMKAEATQLWNEGEFARYFVAMDRLARLDPGNHGIALDVGSAYARRFDFERAHDSFERAVSTSKEKAGTLEMIALHYRNAGRHDLAEQYLGRASAIQPVAPDTLAKLAEMYERLRRLDKARDVVDRALKLDAESPLALLVKSRLERLEGHLEEAELTVRRFLGKTDVQSWSTRIRGWYELGMNLDRQARYDEAMKALMTAKEMIRPIAKQMIASQAQAHAKLRDAELQITSSVFERWNESTNPGTTPPQSLALICGHPVLAPLYSNRCWILTLVWSRSRKRPFSSNPISI